MKYNCPIAKEKQSLFNFNLGKIFQNGFFM